MNYDRATIYSLASGTGKSAIAIIRVSGPGCKEIGEKLCRRAVFPERYAIYGNIYDESGLLLDKGIVIYFSGPRSFTGEDMIEFQVTGGRAVKNGLLKSLASFAAARPAEAGEFARRAFENGKMDLIEVEGLAAIVDADTAAEARHSALMAFGKVSLLCEQARSQLLHAASLLEGILDFSDVEDPDDTSLITVRRAISEARATLELLLDNGKMVERLRDGYAVAIVGAPNAGKSTLLNYILRREALIVSDIPGTTRDFIEFHVELDGYPIVFIDTAGFRLATDPIEKLGIERSLQRVRTADLIIWLSETHHDDDRHLPADVPVIKVRSKADLDTGGSRIEGIFELSGLSGHGVSEVLRKIADYAAAFFANIGEAGVGTERQRLAISQALVALDRSLAASVRNEELIAEDVRSALVAVGRVTGRVDVEDVLDEVFARLCVGK